MGLLGDVILPYLVGGFASDFPPARMVAYLGGVVFAGSLMIPWLQYRFLARLGWWAIVGTSLFTLWADKFVSLKSAILGFLLDFFAGGVFRLFDMVASVGWVISFFAVNRAIDEEFEFRKAWKIEFGEAAPRPFYYGQVMCVLACAIGAFGSAPVTTFLGLANRISQEFGVPEKDLATYGGIGRLLGFLPLIFVGHLHDRFGPRSILGVTLLLLGLSCMAVPAVKGPWTFLVATFFLQSFGLSLTLIGSTVVSFWYEKRLGLAEGSLGVKFPFIYLALIPNFLLNFEYSGVSWRWIFVLLGGTILLIITPLFWLPFRNKPSDIGKEIDGEPTDPSLIQNRGIPIPSPSWGGCLRSPALWTFIFVLSLVFFVEGMANHQMITSLMTDNTDPGALFRELAIFMAIGCLCAGMAVDRIQEKFGVAGAIGLFCFGFGIVFRLWPILQPMDGWRVVGFAEGALLGASGPIWARHFGLDHMGKIRALVLFMTHMVIGLVGNGFSLGSSLSPHSLWAWITVGVCLLAGLAVLFTRVPTLQLPSETVSSPPDGPGTLGSVG